MTTASILAALAKLDLANDNHWTSDGLPRLDTVKLLAGDQTLTREALALAAPGYTRASAYAAAQGSPAPTPAPAAIDAPATPAAATTPETEGGDEPGDEDQSDDEFAAAQQKLAELRTAKQDADAAYRAQVELVDAMITAREKAGVSERSTPLAIQQYLAGQRAKLAARGEQMRKVQAFEKEHGFKLADLAPKRAPIDAAMARKTGRGGKRPSVL